MKFVNKMYNLDQLATQIKEGKSFLIAGDESLLSQLPKGNWIGGTIPYFMGENGGVVTKKELFATELPHFIKKIDVSFLNTHTIKDVYKNAPQNGFMAIIIPASTDMHLTFATGITEYADFAKSPLVGWISGVHLSDLGKIAPKVINGATGQLSDKDAVLLKVELPSDYACEVGIVNIFNQGQGDTIEFLETGFNAKEALVNGQKTNFAEYVKSKKLDTRLPLVADYAGAKINVSFQGIDEAKNQVNFYAPVFTKVQYKMAAEIKNYVTEFENNLPKDNSDMLFSCNCILNFLHSELEGKKTANITGPITFGEVAYQLLNQTMVYLQLQKLN